MTASKNVKNRQSIEVVALALRCRADGKYLVARRGPVGAGSGEWEFPGGKVEAGEKLVQSLIREIREELDFDLTGFDIQLIGDNLHSYEKQDIKIYLWLVETSEKPNFRLIDHDKVEWCSVVELKEINLSGADKYFISLLK